MGKKPKKVPGDIVRYKGLWFWSPKDTIAHSEIGSYHPRELYIGDEHDHASVHYNNTDSIIGKCDVCAQCCFASFFFFPEISHPPLFSSGSVL